MAILFSRTLDGMVFLFPMEPAGPRCKYRGAPYFRLTEMNSLQRKLVYSIGRGSTAAHERGAACGRRHVRVRRAAGRAGARVAWA
ncbi:hypothetical protein DK45_4617 [Bordetella bronchiseptica]|nr:hypothetical protein DK45_4617 [Bordetella bronchiseptica]